MSRVGYNLKQSFSQMNRNKGMYFTSTMAITAMMLILGLFFVTFVNINLFAAAIEKDYNVIQNKIMSGQAHNISEGDTVVLGACTKGSGKSYYTTQPFSDILAKRRAFCIKLPFMRELTRLIFSGELKNKNIIAFVDKECLARIRAGRTA